MTDGFAPAARRTRGANVPPAADTFLSLSAAGARLAAGDGSAAEEVRDWSALFAVMARERIAVLAWVRNGHAIRARADAALVRAWRQLWAEATARAEAAIQAYGEACDLLAPHGVEPVLLKGMALAQRLYGDPCVRCSDDVDCFIAPSLRGRTERALVEGGWKLELGAAPGDQTFSRTTDRACMRLEVHSSLVSDRLRHLPVPTMPAASRILLGGRLMLAHVGPLAPAYLAAHLATHFAPPLLWWLDFHGVWDRLDVGERDGARRAARGAGLARYLEWAVRNAGALDDALGGRDAALRALGVSDSGRRDRHQLWRHVALAPDATGARQALATWVRPEWAAERDGGLLLGTLRRLRRHWRLLLPVLSTERAIGKGVRPANGPLTAIAPAAVRTLDAAGVLAVARAVTSAGGEFPIALTGTSMAPALRPSEQVLLGPLPGSPSRGDIVLADVGGRPVVHRVVAGGDASRPTHREPRGRFARGESPPLSAQGPPPRWLRTQGDACLVADRIIDGDRVVARVVASLRDGRWTAHVLTLRFGAPALTRGLWWRARAPLAHCWRRASGDGTWLGARLRRGGVTW